MKPVLPATIAAVALLLGACTSGPGQNDPLQVAQNPVAATPPPAPEQARKPAGQVLSLPGDATAVAFHPRSGVLAVAGTAGGRAWVSFRGPGDLAAKPRTVDVPGPVEQLVPEGDTGFVGTVPGKDRVVFLSPTDEVVGESEVEGGPADVADQGARRLVALRAEKAIAVLEYEQRVKTITGELASADHVLTVGDSVVVLDRIRSALFEVDVDEGTVGVGLRAGDGATNAVADSFGRVLVTDTRSNALLAFSPGPLLLRQRYPVPGGIYGIAYDARRNLAWVTLTGRNEVVAFDVAGGEPTEKLRFATVRQPNSVTVEESTGRVVVASAAGEGLQVIEP